MAPISLHWTSNSTAASLPSSVSAQWAIHKYITCLICPLDIFQLINSNMGRSIITQGTFQVVKELPSIIFVCRISGHPPIHGSIPFLSENGEKVVHLIWHDPADLLQGCELSLEQLKTPHLIWCIPIIGWQGHIYWGLNNNLRTRSRSWWFCECL